MPLVCPNTVRYYGLLAHHAEIDSKIKSVASGRNGEAVGDDAVGVAVLLLLLVLLVVLGLVVELVQVMLLVAKVLAESGPRRRIYCGTWRSWWFL
jgi:hypothetical protein